MTTTGLEVRLTEGRERAEVLRFTKTLDEIVRSLREIDQVYLRRGTRATWVLADLSHQRNELVVRLEARPSTSERSAEDMLKPVDALVSGAQRLAQVPEVPEYFTQSTVGRLVTLASAKEGLQGVSLAPYNGTTGRSVFLSDAIHQNASEAVRASEMSYGSVSGILDLLSTGHKGKGVLRLNIYDLDSRAVVQAFIDVSHSEKLRELWLHRVLVGGIIKRNRRGQVIRIDVDRVEPLPESNAQRPATAELLGIAPDWLGGKSVDEYLREVRGES